ncbi:MAG: hypothetical protein KatS3mg105_0574 [Gemmatales bacterium]|nr:MAG: hypothetical protein KatS3mg105_0574 [Gemmatales bacterium]
MTISVDLNSRIGIELASRLGLPLNRREGHDLAGPCISCNSSDAFRLHEKTGVGYCYSCCSRWSPFQVAETVLGDRERAKELMRELGVFPSNGSNARIGDPIEIIARQKGITPESLRAFGAQTISPTTIQLPAYGPDGKPCTTFTISTKPGTRANKGLFAKGKPAGLFFPDENGKVRLPRPGEVWHMVEGPKDAAALHDLGLLACGTNTCRLAAKFARLFAGVEVVLIPDRDRAGEDGSQFSARVLHGVAKSVRIAVLPAEFKESDGEDVRDILRKKGGREQLLQAIDDAQPPEWWASSDHKEAAPAFASAEIPLPEGEPLKLSVSPAGRQPHRLIVAMRGDVEHRDRINTDSSTSRDRFINKLATKIGVERDTLAPLVEPQLTKLASEIDATNQLSGGHDESEAQSQATLAADMAADWDLWHTPSKEAYATIEVGNHKENWPVKSQTFRGFVAKRFFDEYGKAMNSEAVSAAINLLQAKALFEGDEHPVYVRLAEHEGNIYLDLCNDDWQAVEITPQGWEIIDDPPVRFRRSRGMLALPTPESGGSVDMLRGFLNLDDSAWRLVVSWLVATLRPRGPYPVLALFAEQGSGKSTIGRLLRELVDPNAAPLRAEPRDGRDLMIAANNSWCLAFDNLSHVQPWLSDALCRLSTGGGFTTRELYTDQDEVIFDSQRPLLLTSIEEVATRSDLLDRCLIVWLPAIPEENRRAEAELFDAFDKVRAQILGALLDAVAVALDRLPSIKLPGLPRMADFALWATAAETAFGWPDGTFMEAYQGNRESANEVALEASVVARPLLDLLEERSEWIGSSGELLKVLEERLGDQVRRLAGWPKNPRSLSGHLKRLAPNLRAAGWTVDLDRNSKKRLWSIRPLPRDANSSPATGPSSFASPSEQSESMPTDADWCDADEYDANDANDANAGHPGLDEQEYDDEVPF